METRLEKLTATSLRQRNQANHPHWTDASSAPSQDVSLSRAKSLTRDRFPFPAKNSKKYAFFSHSKASDSQPQAAGSSPHSRLHAVSPPSGKETPSQTKQSEDEAVSNPCEKNFSLKGDMKGESHAGGNHTDVPGSNRVAVHGEGDGHPYEGTGAEDSRRAVLPKFHRVYTGSEGRWRGVKMKPSKTLMAVPQKKKGRSCSSQNCTLLFRPPAQAKTALN